MCVPHPDFSRRVDQASCHVDLGCICSAGDPTSFFFFCVCVCGVVVHNLSQETVQG